MRQRQFGRFYEFGAIFKSLNDGCNHFGILIVQYKILYIIGDFKIGFIAAGNEIA